VGSSFFSTSMMANAVEFPEALLLKLRSAARVVVLTGAGISQESGLRTFRDPQNGLWRQYRPEELASPEGFRRNPKQVWDWYAYRREAVKGARPNPAHYALVEMERHVPYFTLITQNVDGLHQMAGSRNVIELHGNIQRVRCSVCGESALDWEDDGLEVPRCERCGGLLRPDVVWFGEPLPAAALQAAVEAARQAQVFFSIGTSGIVQPAASLPYAAKNRGALLIEINLETTPLTPRADFAFHGKAGEILPALVRASWGE
jgi:NAD-dependent deacetylase